jgi:hypothetical protein
VTQRFRDVWSGARDADDLTMKDVSDAMYRITMKALRVSERLEEIEKRLDQLESDGGDREALANLRASIDRLNNLPAPAIYGVPCHE